MNINKQLFLQKHSCFRQVCRILHPRWAGVENSQLNIKKSLQHCLLPELHVELHIFFVCKSRGKNSGLVMETEGHFSEGILSTSTLRKEENVRNLTSAHFPERIRSASRKIFQVSFTVSSLYEFCFKFHEEISYSDPC